MKSANEISRTQNRKIIRVAAAVIVRRENETPEILTVTRGYGKYQGFREFPGGKIEAGESAQIALIREILEELGVRIACKDFLCTVEYDYDDFHLSMDCFLCEIQEGTPVPLENQTLLWLKPAQLDTNDWLPADLDVVKVLRNMK